MDPVRKLLGVCILIFMGVPALCLVTWFVGITRAVSQPDFLPDLPIHLSEELPETIEVLFEAAQHPMAVEDDDARAWIQAAARARTSPRELLEEIGLLDWLRYDLSGSLREIFMVLEGRIHPDVITLDMRPLRRAFEHEAIDRYFFEMMENLPACDADQEAAWKYAVQGKRSYRRRAMNGIPACRPDQEVLFKVAERLERRRADMPDGVVLFKRNEFKLWGMNLFSIAFMFSLLMFLIPGFLIAAGAFVAEPMNLRILKWSGIPVLIGGLSTLFTAMLPKMLLLFVSWLVVWTGVLQYDSAYMPPGLDGEIMNRIRALALTVIDPLLSPVVTTALIVTLVGAALLALSFIFPGRSALPTSPPPIPRD